MIFAILTLQVLPVRAEWRQGSVDESGFYDFDYDDANNNFQFDPGEAQVYVDSDSDYLSDFEERSIGSNIYNPDTDGDGLTDFDEVSGLYSVGWVSDPTNWDSDGDGYSDGDEFWGCYTVNYHNNPSGEAGWNYFDWDADGASNYQDAFPFDPLKSSYVDSDGDGSYDDYDSDPQDANLWEDFNRNGINDSEEVFYSADDDGDGYDNSSDSHPNDPALWSDWNYDGSNDQQDSDGDGVPDENDSHSYDPNLWGDWNYDGNNDGQDSDGDGVPDESDSHPNDANVWSDWNNDGSNDLPDGDGDGVPDQDDSHPYDANLWGDWNYDGTNDEEDSDGDGVPDQSDSHPYDASLWSDWNFSGINDDQQSDEDGVADDYDSDPFDSSLWEDWNRNGANDSSEGGDPIPDSDGDGYDDSLDSHPSDPGLWSDWNANGINDDLDSDGDGVPDEYDSHAFEASLWSDWNYNGVNDDQDADGDGVTDDADSDPYTSNLWDDWDRDGTNDSEEPQDQDGDGYLDATDSDPTNYWLWEDWNRNGINDSQESPPVPEDSDGDGMTDDIDPYPNDYYNGDSDQDGLLDEEEAALGAIVGLWDTDGDGLSDGQEVHEAGTNPSLVDTDQDGLTDYEEVNAYASFGLSPTNSHSLSASVDDWEMARMVDTDHDGIPNEIELLWGLNPSNASDAAGDLDGDGMSNLAQYQLGLGLNINLVLYDADRDGMSDAWEAAHGLSCINFDDAVSDTDADGVFAFEEYRALLDPNDATTYKMAVPVKSLQAPYDKSPVVLSDWQRFYWSVHRVRSEQLPFTGSPFIMFGLGGSQTVVMYRYLLELFSFPGMPAPLYTSLYPNFTSTFGPYLLAPAKSWSWDASGAITSWYMSPAAAGNIAWLPGFFPAGTIPENFVLPAIPAAAPASSSDWDGDGMPNAWEYRYAMTIRANDSNFDPDFDYLTNLKEFQAHTDPTIASTDDDLLSDYWETKLGYDPRRSDSDGDGVPDHLEDSDGDGINEQYEIALGTNPMIQDARSILLEVHVMAAP